MESPESVWRKRPGPWAGIRILYLIPNPINIARRKINRNFRVGWKQSVYKNEQTSERRGKRPKKI